MKKNFFISIIIFAWLLIALITSINYNNLPYNGTWGSDAEYYYTSAIDSLNWGSCTSYLAPGYVCTLKNILFFPENPIFSYTLILVLYIKIASHILTTEKNITIKTLSLLLVYNPIILWNILKGVKESLILLILLAIIVVYQNNKKHYTLKKLILMFVLFIYLSTLKPDVSLYLITSLITTQLIFRSKNRFFTSILLLILAISFLYLINYAPGIFSSLPMVSRLLSHQELFFYTELGQESIEKNIIKSIFRFLIGPGPITPITAFYDSSVFYEPTFLGKILISTGSFFWIVLIAICIPGFTQLKKIYINEQELKTIIFTSSMGFFYILTYAFMYGGMVDTRHRAIVYLLLTPLITKLLKPGVSKIKSFLRIRTKI